MLIQVRKWWRKRSLFQRLWLLFLAPLAVFVGSMLYAVQTQNTAIAGWSLLIGFFAWVRWDRISMARSIYYHEKIREQARRDIAQRMAA